MSQTKRKRRSKHRGNAAGRVEARGRTGRKPTGPEVKPGRGAAARAQANDRRNAVPTWKSAAAKSGFASVVLFAFIALDVFNTGTPIATAAFMSVFAFALYTPLTFSLDRVMYARRMRKQAKR